jgi:hypothetical protein
VVGTECSVERTHKESGFNYHRSLFDVVRILLLFNNIRGRSATTPESLVSSTENKANKE